MSNKWAVANAVFVTMMVAGVVLLLSSIATLIVVDFGNKGIDAAAERYADHLRCLSRENEIEKCR